MIVYIGGKMTGLPDLGRSRFARAEERLQEAGHIVINPAVLPDGLAPDAYMPICLAMLDAADAIFLLDNWRESPGAQLELGYARYQGKRILCEEDENGDV